MPTGLEFWEQHHLMLGHAHAASALPPVRSVSPRRRRQRGPGAGIRSAGRYLATALTTIAALLALGCGTGAAGEPRGQATPTPTPAANSASLMPAFHDWRAAYLGQDSNVHIVTLDGKTDLKGPEFPDLGGYQAGLGFWSGGVSPDGHHLAFSIDQLVIVNLAMPNAPHLTATTAGGLVYDMAWSPDSAHLAVSGGGGIDILDVSGSGPPELLDNAKTSLTHPLVGWIDATHVVYISDIQMGQPSPSGLWLDAVDVTTDQVRRIAAIPAVLSVSGNVPNITLSPDGRQAVLSNVDWRDYAFTPTVDVLDTATGQITTLPTISQITNASWAGPPAWKPGTETLAVTTYVSSAASPEGFAPRIWSVDLAHDTADLLPGGDGWYALGWAPDDGPLVVGTSGGTSGVKLSQQPHKLAAVTYLSADQTQILALTQTAVSFPFIGFVRTT